MTEGKIIEARAQAMKDIEPLIRVLNQTLLETYMAGFMKGLQSCEESKEILNKRLADEEEALKEGMPISEEPLVRLKTDAILKRRLKQDDFPCRVWNTFRDLNIETLGDILEHSEKFYLGRSKFGHGSLNTVKKYVESFGYKLREK